MAAWESIWSGKGSLPWESGHGWEQRYRPDISGARREQLLTQQDMQKAKHVLPADTGIGIGSIKATPAAKARCRGCGQLHPVHSLTAKLILCPTCRPGRQRAVLYA